jgi:hypothetical protein
MQVYSEAEAGSSDYKSYVTADRANAFRGGKKNALQPSKFG